MIDYFGCVVISLISLRACFTFGQCFQAPVRRDQRVLRGEPRSSVWLGFPVKRSSSTAVWKRNPRLLGRKEEGFPAVPAAREEAAVGCRGAHVRTSQQPSIELIEFSFFLKKKLHNGSMHQARGISQSECP
jgi:hypothetical protein